MRLRYIVSGLVAVGLVISQRLPKPGDVQSEEKELLLAGIPSSSVTEIVPDNVLLPLPSFPPGKRPQQDFTYTIPQSNVSLRFYPGGYFPTNFDKEIKQLFRIAQQEAFSHADELDLPCDHDILTSVRVRGGLLKLEIRQDVGKSEISMQYFTWGTVIRSLIGLSTVHQVYPLADLKAYIAVVPNNGIWAERPTLIAKAAVVFKASSLTI